jgi:Spy/CpxP family protein refolding chaperone
MDTFQPPQHLKGGFNMHAQKRTRALVILTVLTIVGFGAYAYADWGMGYGHRMGMHGRSGMGMNGGANMGYGCPGWNGGGPGWQGTYGPGYRGNLAPDQIKALDEARSAFFKETESIRQDLYAKNLELRSALAKPNPDTRKAAQLQKEISDLRAKFDQKRLDHMVKMRAINPQAGRGFAGGYGPGYGPGRGGANCAW